ncbi:hypothetical protein C0J52_20502 [Blattella germanica]|nr:hypothetical protein C0J52_20502 [Blattella germanica]
MNAIDPIKKAIYQDRMNSKDGRKNFLSLEEGMDKVRKGLFAFHTTIHSYNIMAATFEEEEKCGVQEIVYFDDQFMAHTAISKQTPYKEILSLAFRRMDESGIQTKLMYDYYRKKPKCDGSGAYYLSVGLLDCYPVMIIFVIGISCSILVFVLEFFVHKV